MLGEKLKKAVNQSRLTADEAARGLGVSVSNLYVLYKKDTFSLDYVKKASELLGVPMSYFLGTEIEGVIKTPKRNDSEVTALGAIADELRILREQLQIKDQQIAGLQRTVDVLVGKSEGAIVEPLFAGMDDFERKLLLYRLVGGLQMKKYKQSLRRSRPVAKLVAPR
ncbi:XRE family transcriptional regulator [Fibrisoma montanum]|uniref:XRE family transcriptional regulator n=1 Tax=Fibrisoma montanum TaxID=2305895 RepID=A0A418M4H0_9BACT|nr:helix-turn-helix transcriptional regulator [Fibrisoma montanum]RIV20564.1 XRE family transcriptional regulator [Fibrisoma montanum]